MLFVKSLLVLAATVNAGLLGFGKTNPSDVDVKTLDQDVLGMISALQSYNGGGLAKTAPIKAAVAKYGTDVNLVTEHLKADAGINLDVTADLVGLLTSTFIPDLKQFFSLLEAKKAIFVADGLVSQVKAGLERIKSETDTLSQTLLSKVPKVKIPQVKNVLNDYNASISAAIALWA
ncbi:hypothetical protein E4U43_000725 [Claviceps pusilla]|uniref:Antigenic cell wall galactomannoprotein n=1 Tax=Claviceps pusilla TaxID=123648 RepID=A0A9P7N9B6_9HYPO|nr:hypothetical protein E4U43_000725 [Claviceps pusilla]